MKFHLLVCLAVAVALADEDRVCLDKARVPAYLAKMTEYSEGCEEKAGKMPDNSDKAAGDDFSWKMYICIMKNAKFVTEDGIWDQDKLKQDALEYTAKKDLDDVLATFKSCQNPEEQDSVISAAKAHNTEIMELKYIGADKFFTCYVLKMKILCPGDEAFLEKYYKLED